MKRLTVTQESLLLEIIMQLAPHLLGVTKEAALHNAWTLELTEQVLDHLASELCSSGLRDDDEPNERGLLLEDLIGALSLEAQELTPNE